MNHNVFLSVDLLINEEITNIRSLISLELNHLAMFLIVHNSSVTCKALFPRLQDQLQVQIRRQALNRCNTLTTVSLLNSDMFK